MIRTREALVTFVKNDDDELVEAVTRNAHDACMTAAQSAAWLIAHGTTASAYEFADEKVRRADNGSPAQLDRLERELRKAKAKFTARELAAKHNKA